MNESRWDLDDIFMACAVSWSKRSTCIRRHVGAVIAKDNVIISAGYNGAPSTLEHCTTIGCLRDQLGIEPGTHPDKCRAVHGEMNVILHAAKNGFSINGGTMYITHKPCGICSRMIINSGIRRVVYMNDYPDSTADELLHRAGILLEQWNKSISLVMDRQTGNLETKS